jgi:hypothetical protein
MWQPHCSLQLSSQLPSLPIAFNHTSVLIIMIVFLRKSKASLLEQMKSMPNVHIAEEEDFIVWG